MRKAVTAAAVLLVAYAASPYISLYEIGQDVRGHDVSAISADVDWTKLREGLKEDIADGITGNTPASATPQATPVSATTNDDDLPPFGSGFVNNMAGNMVDQTVTPQHLANTVSTLRAAGADRMMVQHAFFTSPTRFDVTLQLGHDKVQPPLRLQLDLVRSGMTMRWKVTRAWLPTELLAASEAHAS